MVSTHLSFPQGFSGNPVFSSVPSFGDPHLRKKPLDSRLQTSGMTEGAWGMTEGAWGMTEGAWGMTEGAWGMTEAHSCRPVSPAVIPTGYPSVIPAVPTCHSRCTRLSFPLYPTVIPACC